MMEPRPDMPWYDARWRVKSDNLLQAGLRLQQGWWRQECLGVPESGRLYPPPKGRGQRKRNPLVVSMLPNTVTEFMPNLMWNESVRAFHEAEKALGAGAGILYEDRLRRNLLSSQPLCFNLLGYLGQADPNALLPWVRSFAPNATEVANVRLEYAPSAVELGVRPLGGSAFDAFIEYSLTDGRTGFLGIETKYHEDLAKGLTIPSEGSCTRMKYEEETSMRPWREGAASRMYGERKYLQFWYNQLLAQRTFELVKDPSGIRRYAEYTQLVVASRHDASAKHVVEAVAGLLAEDHVDTLRFSSIEDLVVAVRGHDAWKQAVTQRYTDFAPIQRYLPHRSPLRDK